MEELSRAGSPMPSGRFLDPASAGRALIVKDLQLPLNPSGAVSVYVSGF
jgi:hypothetical protein